ncbi:DUF1349 domain-containing protein [Tenggerimyces flavus]|uniref:DUF1349 domain-containing protein n=1 Tax=Tenggerimyces flavus TaxID=1708749 RepID=A0ABV7Y7T6_9ACTN|nr:hypothetical protein [Tenggerimyces flavus]MBM7785273.1 hypothetical protein [Tenggerimyces flavus]
MSTFLRPGRVIALIIAALAIIAFGLLYSFGMRASCDPGPCPPASPVSDKFWFLHRDLGPEGSITVRLASMTGTITYPPPNHDEIVSGLVPWAKVGLIVKDGLREGSPYAAVMLTGNHGVRFQYDYDQDVAGRTGDWLRLTRSGDTITGFSSTDGQQWQRVGTAKFEGLPDTVQVGLFATSPGDLTLREVGLGGAIEEVRFTQAVGVFDHVTVEGSAGGWQSDPVGGEMNHTDWEKYHNPSGAVQKDGVITVSGSGDIGPVSDGLAPMVKFLLLGLVVALVIVLVVGARATYAPVLVGAAAFVTGLVGVGVILPVGMAILAANGVPVPPLPLLTGVRVVVGAAVVLGLGAVFANGLSAWLRRRWLAIVVAVLLVAVPYVLTAFPLLPDVVADWLLRLTPAAGFAVLQTAVEYPQVTAHYAPSSGYFPLPWWAGLTVLAAYALAAMAASGSVGRRR